MSKHFRDAFLNAGVGSEIVVVPIRGVDYKVEVRQRTVRQQYDLLDKIPRRPDGSYDGMLLGVETIIACCFDPDTGERMFDPADRDLLLDQDAQVFQTLLAAANRAAGLETLDEATTRLEETPADESSTG